MACVSTQREGTNMLDKAKGAMDFALGELSPSSVWDLVALVVLAIVTIVYVIGAYRSLGQVAKAVDLGFDKDRLDKHNLSRPPETAPREVNWVKARKQQVRSIRFTIPLGVICWVSLWFWLTRNFTLWGYVVIAIGWLLFMPVLRVWWIATLLRSERKLNKHEPANARGELASITVFQAVRHYLNWGLNKRTRSQRTFIGRLRFLNGIWSILFLRWLKLGLIRPILVCAFYAATWVVSMTIAPFYLTREFDERRHALKPEWASDYAPEPRNDSGVIRDTPGDAAAASS
jgi:hypothetical protein